MQLLVLFGLFGIAAAGQLCMNCKNLVNPHECDLVTKCGDHEQCYMVQYLRHGQIWYDLGCMSNLVCNAAIIGPPIPVIGKREKTQDSSSDTFNLDVEDDDSRIPVCESCCNSTICNNGGACGVGDFNYYGGRLCFKCGQQLSPDSCDRVTLCYQDRFCYIHKKKPDVGFTYVWETGCAETTQNCTQTFGTICSRCCTDNLCNDECNIQTYAPPVHHRTTTTTTTTTPKPTTTTTPKPTTTTPSAKPPHIISVRIIPQHFRYGDNVQMRCTIESNPKYDVLGWNMLTDPSNIPPNIHLNYGINAVTVDITNFQRENEGDYQCFVHNSEGQDVRTVKLMVHS
ncbi:uncharacterized protein LOC125662337 [Ostrea edulis]|uniref:uncharacterized protein LOC125662337 n=1 Tax=Ostrea edulis TaxID=37623 RepID=UPI0024AFE49B|nr:uncharacterized protein LOC125662337 [Ostrea edulis]